MMEPLPYAASPAEYRQQVDTLLQAARQRDKTAVQFIHQYNGHLQKLSEEEFVKYEVTQQDAEKAILEWYHFKGWNDLERYAKAVKEEPAIAQFEQAVEAIIAGDIVTLTDLLQKNPSLINDRSIRWHGSMLIHYTGANGVEDFRQKTPSNAVEVLKILLKAGADVNATAHMYGGGSTTFGLTATSIWPAKAGVLIHLLETLLAAGADVGGPGAVRDCLANGRPQAADALVRYGATLDLEEAAGVGRLDIVKTYFDDNKKLKDETNRKKMENGMIWACEYGHTPVVEFLLDAGLNPDRQVDGMAGLHWAVLGAHQDTVELLLARGASVENRNKYGGAVLGATLWAVIHSDPVYRWPDNKVDYPKIIETILKAGAQVSPEILQWVKETDEIPGDQKAPIVQIMEKYSA